MDHHVFARSLEFFFSNILSEPTHTMCEALCVGAAVEDGRGEDEFAGELHIDWWIERNKGWRRVTSGGLLVIVV